MILDTYERPHAEVLQAQLCVIGAGAAGITIAHELAGSGIDVLLLEAGGLTAEKSTQALYCGAVADARLHSPPDRYRQRRFGGSTTIWGGRCTPFDEIDFEPREYVPYSGWPFGRDELMPYYAKANRLCEAGRFAYLAREAFQAPLRPMLAGFESRYFSTDTLERFSCPTDFGRRYIRKLTGATNVRVLLHANVIRIKLDADGKRVVEVAVGNLGGKRLSVKAQCFVLSTGGLEVPRLLLASRDVHTQGIGNQHDVIGRFYMCHLAGTIGRIQIAGPLENAYHGYDVSEEGIYCRRRLALRPEVQRQLGLGNFVARLHHPRITDPAHRNAVLSLLYLAKFVIPYEYGKRLYGEDGNDSKSWVRHLFNVVRDPTEASAFAWHMLRDRKLAARKFPSIIIRSKANLYSLDFHAEQQPNPLSRVTLGSDLDALGMPQLLVDWRYSHSDVDTVSRALALVADEFGRSGIARFDYDPDSVELEMTRYGAYGGHHIGTARMGSDPRTSVVNADGRMHGVNNLYVAGSAIFPTSSQANPTLTIVALALRMTEHLKVLLGR